NDAHIGEFIIFDSSKKQTFTPNNGFKTLTRKLKSSWKVMMNKEPLSKNLLASAKIFIIACPNQKYSTAEFDALKSFLENGGNLVVMMGEGGEGRMQTNINFFIEQFGISVRDDVVLRSHYYKYFHPKEAFICNGVVNRLVGRASGKWSGYLDEDSRYSQALSFVYPYGCTLNVQRPAVIILSSGGACFPLNRSICAINKSMKGKLLVLGSQHMFSDHYLEKDDNSKLLANDVFLNLLTTDDVQLNLIDAENPEISDYNMLPNTAQLSDQAKSCLQETDEVPRDITTLFTSSLFTLDTTSVPKVIKAYEQLKVPHETLTLIAPQIETPLPPLQPAVFPPTFRDLPAPPLDLYDLDEQFTSEKARLAQLTNKCSENDLEYYVKECGHILGLSSSSSSSSASSSFIPAEKFTAKNVLEFVMNKIIMFKKLQVRYMCVCFVRVRVCMCMSTCVCVYIYMCVFVCVMCVCLCIYVCMYVCVCVCVCVFVFVSR
ncbi:hypothetical protein HELRODRAFT_78455, partial [Helobdella robusta]|uniref:ABC-type uncharacterized transport system domain-containing protein n=1 Tax=Helobdella robusta TaxID=6412 RepID=T1G3B9_HELRO